MKLSFFPKNNDVHREEIFVVFQKLIMYIERKASAFLNKLSLIDKT